MIANKENTEKNKYPLWTKILCTIVGKGKRKRRNQKSIQRKEASSRDSFSDGVVEFSVKGVIDDSKGICNRKRGRTKEQDKREILSLFQKNLIIYLISKTFTSNDFTWWFERMELHLVKQFDRRHKNCKRKVKFLLWILSC